MMDDAEFQRGAIDIQWLERKLASLLERLPSAESVRVAAIAAAMLAERDKASRATSTDSGSAALPAGRRDVALDSWKQAARAEALRD
jgi:TATA-binding protein-associated factor Taf7